MMNLRLRNYFILLVSLITFFSCKDSSDDTGIVPPEEPPMEEKITPDISITSVEGEEGNDETTFKFVVQLSEGTDEKVSVDFRTKEITAIAGEDFEGKEGTLEFLTGETEKNIEIKILGDEEFEEDEKFELILSNAVNGELINESVEATIINDDAEPYDGYVSPLEYPGYNLVWQDEFSGDEINSNHWNHEIGNSGWGNNEWQNYTAREDNSYIDNGKLIIEAKQESFGGSDYTSARMISAGKQEFQYGRVDVRAKLPEGQGIWPAIWMLGKNIWTVSWPDCGEIDIMELVGHQPSTVHGTMHWSSNGNHAYYGGSTSLDSGKFSDEFHVFSIIWDEKEIRWLLDNEQYHVANIESADVTEFHEEFFFIFNIAVGGNWPGYPDATTVFPQKMYIDYIRVFQE